MFKLPCKCNNCIKKNYSKFLLIDTVNELITQFEDPNNFIEERNKYYYEYNKVLDNIEKNLYTI